MKPTFCVPGGEMPTAEQFENRNLADAQFDAHVPGRYVVYEEYDDSIGDYFACICGMLVDEIEEKNIILAPSQYIYELKLQSDD